MNGTLIDWFKLAASFLVWIGALLVVAIILYFATFIFFEKIFKRELDRLLAVVIALFSSYLGFRYLSPLSFIPLFYAALLLWYARKWREPWPLAHGPPPEFTRGRTFHMETRWQINAEELSKNLMLVCPFLDEVCSGVKLFSYDDWWEHDGLYFKRDILEYADLIELISTPEAILSTAPADGEVCIGIWPEDSRWYLRYNMEIVNTDGGRMGYFDISLTPSLVQDFIQRVLPNLSVDMVEQDTREYFKSIKAL